MKFNNRENFPVTDKEGKVNWISRSVANVGILIAKCGCTPSIPLGPTH